MKLGQLVERVETGRTMAYNTAAYLSRGEGPAPHAVGVQTQRRHLGKEPGRTGDRDSGLGVSDVRIDPSDFWGGWLRSFASTIAGGSDEIQHDIIGTRYFGISS